MTLWQNSIYLWTPVFKNILRTSQVWENICLLSYRWFSSSKCQELSLNNVCRASPWQACWFPPGDSSQSQHVQNSSTPPPLTPRRCHNSARILMFYTKGGGVWGARITWRRLENSPQLLWDFKGSWSPFAHQNPRDQETVGKQNKKRKFFAVEDHMGQ